MTPSFHLLDTVALLHDLPEHDLVRGHVGTLVEALADGVWLAEFSDDDGRTYAMPAVHDDQVIALRFAPAA